MPIPNISTLYQRISKGSEGGHEFARFMKLLLGADYTVQGINFISESDASGDYKKVDAYIPGRDGLSELMKGFQFKFYPAKLSNKHKYEIIQSLEAALQENEFIEEYILVTPEDFMKEEQKWFDSLRRKYEKSLTIEYDGGIILTEFHLIHWGHSKIIELALKHDHLGAYYFPELYPAGVGKFKLSAATIDSEISAWNKSKHNQNSFIQGLPKEHETNMTSDPVFDFQFKNSTNNIHLLKSIDIHIEKVWTTLSGIPRNQFLQSVGTIEHEIDFEQEINSILFPDPFIFEANSPKRFKLRLKTFIKIAQEIMFS